MGERAFALAVYRHGGAGEMAAAALKRLCGYQVDLLDGLDTHSPDRAMSYQFILLLSEFGSDPVPQISGRRVVWRLPQAENTIESSEVASLRKEIAKEIIDGRVEQWCNLCCPNGGINAKRSPASHRK